MRNFYNLLTNIIIIIMINVASRMCCIAVHVSAMINRLWMLLTATRHTAAADYVLGCVCVQSSFVRQISQKIIHEICKTYSRHTLHTTLETVWCRSIWL